MWDCTRIIYTTNYASSDDQLTRRQYCLDNGLIRILVASTSKTNKHAKERVLSRVATHKHWVAQ